MKFLPIFFMMLILSFLFVFFGGILLLEKPFGLMVILALIGAVPIYAYLQQEDKIEKLEQRIKELEEK